MSFSNHGTNAEMEASYWLIYHKLTELFVIMKLQQKMIVLNNKANEEEERMIAEDRVYYVNRN